MKINEPKQSWGGPWTEKKLQAFAKYVWSYLIIMKKHPYWKTIYFDGFAGSGDRGDNTSELMPQLTITQEEERVYQGAAERVLNLADNLSFDYYYFVDKDESSLERLKARLQAMPESKGKALVFRSGDANQWIQELAKALKQKKPSLAALALLDPFGMQINWESIEALKGTKSDVWILVPTGMIVNRLLGKQGELKSVEKLRSFFGMTEDEIRDAFYSAEKSVTLFGEEEIVKKAMKPIEKIAALYVQRLKTVWPEVTDKPLRLENSRGVPIFHLIFASNNNHAVKIASQIISKT